ncbi:MAG TPA: hypothetical protein VK866_14325, partial [Acidimicrobiales bacterium]|nr:hypothetical protein [Acidimicrobiales bacterium]
QAAPPPVEPEPIDESTTEITLIRGGAVPVDIECDGTVLVRVDDGDQQPAEQLDTTLLEVGDHRVGVYCDEALITEVAVTVVEPVADRAGFPGVATAVLLFLCATAVVTVVAPGAATAGARRGGDA